MKHRLGKFGTVFLALALALAFTGAGFAAWTDSLTIEGTVETGNFIVTFDNGGRAGTVGLISNDDGNNTLNMWCDGPYGQTHLPDPDDLGGDPTEPQTMEQNVDRIDNVASTTVTSCGVTDPIVRDVTVTMENAYPSYWPTVFFVIRNWGTIPAKVQSIRVTEVSVGGTKTSVDIPLEVCVPVYLDCDKDGDNDLTLHLSDDEDRLFQIIEAGGGVIGEHGHFESAVCGNLDIHIEDGAEESTSYGFTIEIVAVQWNEYTPPGP